MTFEEIEGLNLDVETFEQFVEINRSNLQVYQEDNDTSVEAWEELSLRLQRDRHMSVEDADQMAALEMFGRTTR